MTRRIIVTLASLALYLSTTNCSLLSQKAPAQINPDTLHLGWRIESGGMIQQPPVAVKNSLVVILKETPIKAFDLDKGEHLWLNDTPAKLLPLSLSTSLDSVMIAGKNGRLMALSPRSGIADWDINLDGDVLVTPFVDRYVIFTPTSQVENLTDKDHAQNATFYALNASTGATLWRYVTNSTALLTPVRSGNSVFVAGNSQEENYIYALSAAEGQLLWMKETSGVVTALFATEDTLISLNEQGILEARDTASGTLIWNDKDEGIPQLLLGWGSLVYVLNGKNLEARDSLTGNLSWEFGLNVRIMDKPTIIDNVLYLLTSDGKLIALNTTNGDLRWQFSTDSQSPAGMIINQGWIVIADKSGDLFAYTSQ
jgi:outer membrane protein assembly factor BamB